VALRGLEFLWPVLVGVFVAAATCYAPASFGRLPRSCRRMPGSGAATSAREPRASSDVVIDRWPARSSRLRCAHAHHVGSLVRARNRAPGIGNP
jgi:hypothetical protein